MKKISDRAIIDENVQIGENCEISHNVVIEGNVIIGNNNYIGPNTFIHGNTIIGNNNWIGASTSIGYRSQHNNKKYEFSDDYNFSMKEKKIVIGDNNVLREFNTVHQPTLKITSIGSNCYFMVYSHISHDTLIFDNAILTNNVQIGGHSRILEYAHIGLNTAIHPRTTVGGFSMIGMGSVITKDILPFVTVLGNPLRINRINSRGMQRYGFTEEELDEVKNQYLQSIKDKNTFSDTFSNPDNYESDKVKQYLIKFKEYSTKKLINRV